MTEDDVFSLRPHRPGVRSRGWTKFGELSPDLSPLPSPIPLQQQQTVVAHHLGFAKDSSPDVLSSSPLLTHRPPPGPPQSRVSGDWHDESRLLRRDEDAEQSHNEEVAAMPMSQNIVVELPCSTLNKPKSLYMGFVPPARRVKESEAVATLLDIVTQDHSDDFVEFHLTDFTVYINNALYPGEMRPLQHLATRQSSDRFYFDGILCVGTTRFFVERVPFRELPIGNYTISEHTVGDQIWIRSELNAGKEIYYKLGKPAVEYARFFGPFLWIADLTKHVLDYCEHLHAKKRRVVLHDFRECFGDFVSSTHQKSPVFQKWFRAHGSTDFRAAIVANVDFIWKEAVGLPRVGRKLTSWHPFWREVKGDRYQPMKTKQTVYSDTTQVSEEDTSSENTANRKTIKTGAPGNIAPTIVTPYIYNLFSHMGFDVIMKPMSPHKQLAEDQLAQAQVTGHLRMATVHGADQQKGGHDFVKYIKPGDVISTPPDAEGTGTKWKRETSKHHGSDYVWYGLVQEVHVRSAHRSFDVIWMYQPRETPCGLMKYPWASELFLSDSCTCETTRVDARDVLATHSTAWCGTSEDCSDASRGGAEFFVRQTYLQEEHCWISFKENHLVCKHRQEGVNASRKYQKGDTVLAKVEQPYLQAFVVEATYREDGKRWARVRRLLRRRDRDTSRTFPPNELLWSDQLIEIDPKRIVRTCVVRAFHGADEIPAPYSYNGTGDVFFLTRRETTGGAIETIEHPRSLSFRQGFDPTTSPASMRLRGLDLFCGGGNFGRGLEDGGGIQMRWANDISSSAVHTYMANTEPGVCTPYLGSIDDLLEKALRGDADVPRPGEIQFISGGSPCQGFSRLTTAKSQATLKQWKNRSLVASFASFIDFYKPQFGLLENVPSMVQGENKRENCFFSQLVCSIVGLGYQVRIIYADAWSFGAPQLRSRVFLNFAAPGVRMPRPPTPSHSHPSDVRMGKLGKMSNGQPIGERVHVLTPFKFVSAIEAAGDLPHIQDGKADFCVGFPDHRLSLGITAKGQSQMRLIPFHPYGMRFDKTYFGYEENGRRFPGIMTISDRDSHFPNPKELRMQPGSKGWGRVHPHDLFRTVVTACNPTDTRTGVVNHWQQQRPLTILEARRAQGFADHEVILGKPHQQWHIVGNSVARQAAMAFGLAIREAWFGTLYDEGNTNGLATDPLHNLTIGGDFGIESDSSKSMEGQTNDLHLEAPPEKYSTPATSVGESADELSTHNNGHNRKRRRTTTLVQLYSKRPLYSMG
ncbi:hypothetical protein JX266_004594 [Neoarthrinium moseri]|nr:hypothetical protein JX266_004594 [Neoarthrinium moseri]